MVIIKYIDAWTQLETFASDKWEEVGNLVKYILDNNQEKAFDDHISMVFPEGADEGEFEEYCCKKSLEIMYALGYKEN